MESGGMSGMSSVSETCASLGRLRAERRRGDFFLPAKWGTDQATENAETPSVVRPPLSNLGSVEVSGNIAPESTFSARIAMLRRHCARLARAVTLVLRSLLAHADWVWGI